MRAGCHDHWRTNDDRGKLRTLERDLKNVVFGQDKALDVLASAVMSIQHLMVLSITGGCWCAANPSR